MTKRTQIICLHEGKQGASIDPVFISVLIKKLDPSWVRPHAGNKLVRTVAKGGRSELITAMPRELRRCLESGGNATLMVWADLDDDMVDGDALKRVFWNEAERQRITPQQFGQVVFVFPKDRIENWIQFMNAGSTDELQEGPRVKYDREAADAARALAEACLRGAPIHGIPPSLQWSCRNWRALVERMRD